MYEKPRTPESTRKDARVGVSPSRRGAGKSKSKEKCHAPVTKNPVGRPKDYNPNLHPWLAERLAAAGHTDAEIAGIFGKAYSTLRKWVAFPEFSAALSRGKEPPNDQVKRSCFQRAIGYSYPSEEVFCAFGKVTRVKTMKHVPPDPTMIQFWLVNRDKENWKHASHVEHAGPGGAPLFSCIERTIIKPTA